MMASAMPVITSGIWKTRPGSGVQSSRRAANDLWNAPAPKRERRGLQAADIASLVGSGFQNRGFRWLLEEGRRITALVDFVAALSRELTAGGLPLQRVYVAQRTLHPQVAALGLELRELANQWLGGRDSIVHLDTPTK